MVWIEQRLLPPADYADQFFANYSHHIRDMLSHARHPGDWPPREMGQRQLRNAKES